LKDASRLNVPALAMQRQPEVPPHLVSAWPERYRPLKPPHALIDSSLSQTEISQEMHEHRIPWVLLQQRRINCLCLRDATMPMMFNCRFEGTRLSELASCAVAWPPGKLEKKLGEEALKHW
jgi:hypothetical protein